MKKQETVVLVHGLGGSRLDMWPIGRRLRQIGFQVMNWGYSSVGTRIERHAFRLAEMLTGLERQQQPFHLVTHSMGGIVARQMLAQHQFDRLNRIVMLAPPNRGSHAARRLAPFLTWFAPSLGQLSDSKDSFVNQLESSLMRHELELGVIVAGKDRVISPDCVPLPGQSDYAKVDGHHGILPWYSDTIRLVEQFLQAGNFKLPDSPEIEHCRPATDAV